MQSQKNSGQSSSSGMSSVMVEAPQTEIEAESVLLAETPFILGTKLSRGSWFAIRRIACFFALVAVLVFGLDAMITSGLRKIKTSQYGVTNQIVHGKVNAQVVITGSSRALSHYDPRMIQAGAGRSAFNIGRNGSQTDMQVAMLKAYLEHNQKPEVVIHNLDAFTFVTTREVYASAQYVPYLYDQELYRTLLHVDRNTWKNRYVPLYGYVVEDMSFAWVLGIRGFFGWSPPEDFFLGFNPRSKKWTDEFDQFKSAKSDGVSWPVEPEGVESLENLMRLCQDRGIQLIFVYSPEYSEMQKLTKNRAEVFGRFQEMADRYHVPLWDYSDWKYAENTEYFQNSQHLNAEGAAVFSQDVAVRLKKYLAERSQLDRPGAGEINQQLVFFAPLMAHVD